MVVGVSGGCSGSRGGGGVLRVRIDVWVAPGGFGWAARCLLASSVRRRLWGAVGGCGWGVSRWGLVAFWGALVVSWRPADGDGGGRVWRAE